MPSYRFVKQAVYGAFSIAVFLGIAGGAYLLFRSPAEPPVVLDVEPLRVSAARVLPAGTSATLLAEVRNPNAGHGAVSLAYTFEARDAAGRTLRTVSGESFIYPGEIKYFVEPVLGIASGAIARVNFSIADALEWRERDEFSRPLLVPRDVRSEVRPGGSLRTAGVIANTETVPFDRLLVSALYKNQAGTIIGASKTELRAIRPFEERFFQIAHPPLPGVDLEKTEIQAEGRRP